MVVQMTDREWRRFVWFVIIAVLILAADTVFAGQVHFRNYAAFYTWCETASSWDYIVSGCWVR